MPSLIPKTKAVIEYLPQPAVDPKDVFSEPRYRATVQRVIAYLSRVYKTHSDGSFDRISRPGYVTEWFFVAMSTVDAYKTEVELVNAIRLHALGNLSDENIKVYLEKYLQSHIFVYREVNGGWVQEFKTGPSPRTSWREVPLFDVSFGKLRSGLVCNAIQAEIYVRLEQASGNNAKYSIDRI